jgi:asparagine synthase (glutamine-hydrolysing)
LIDRLANHNDRAFVSDAALILQAYMKWGDSCMKYLYGDFAFVIFNLQNGDIFGGRDHMGVRPFFYAYEQNVFVFGSELRYVLASFKARPTIRQEYLLETLVTVKSDKGLSPFDNIFRLKPGNFLHCSGGVISISQYWQPDPEKTLRFSREAEYIELFREKLVNAVTMRFTGVSRLGSELSGGLDSSAVTGIATEFAGETGVFFTAFSNIFPSDTGIDFRDEHKFISCMRTFKPFGWVGVDRLKSSVPELLQYGIDIQGCYIQQGFSIFNQSIYEAAGNLGAQVLLSGFGGDELVSARIALPWNEFITERQWKLLFEELFHKGVTLKALLKPGLIVARYIKSLISRPKYTTGVFTPELLDRRFANLPLQPVFAEKYALRKRHEDMYRKPWRENTSLRQYNRIMLEHLPQRMEYCYTAAAQYGVEYRYPLLDADLMETCLAFPPWIKQHHGINRYIFRQAIKSYVPEEIWQRADKSGSTIPQLYFSLLNEKDLILDLVKSCSNSQYLMEIFDLSRFPKWYERLVKRDKADMNYLMPGAFYDYLMILLYYRDSQCEPE